MNQPLHPMFFLIAVGTMSGLLCSAPVAARAAAAGETQPDCSKAQSMMMQPSSPAPEMKSSADIDKDFARAMTVQMEHMLSVTQMEISCGKNAKTKKFAQDSIEQQRAELTQLRLLTGIGE